MTITQTTVLPKTAIGEDLCIQIIAVAFDSVYPTGGEALSLTDFSRIYSIAHAGNDTLADNGYRFEGLSTYTATPSASNSLATCWVNFNPGGSGGSDRVDIEAIATGIKDLSAIGQAMFVILGR
jgi:hypothetical protein